MPLIQLSLWDNELLENGYRFLSGLRMQEAEQEFLNARHQFAGEIDGVQEALDACQFWKLRLSGTNGCEPIGSLVEDYSHYSFSSALRDFQWALLNRIVSLFYETDRWELKHMVAAFDWLLEIEDYTKAEALVSRAISLHSGNHQLHYMKAQVQYLNGEREKAMRAYVWLFLHVPKADPGDRIEDKGLKSLVDKHGIRLAPAFAALYQFVPFIAMDEDIIAQDEDHLRALECYQLIHASNQFLENQDLKESIRCRKRLIALAPDLYKAYFQWLERKQ